MTAKEKKLVGITIVEGKGLGKAYFVGRAMQQDSVVSISRQDIGNHIMLFNEIREKAKNDYRSYVRGFDGTSAFDASILNVYEHILDDPAFIGQVKAPEWLEINWLLSLFGKSRKSAARNYRDFVEKVDMADVENPGLEISGGFILGGVEFVNWVKESFLSDRGEKKEIPQLRQLKPRQTPDAIVDAVCREFSCQAGQILRKGAKKNTARDVAIYLARDLSGESGVDLGKYFGNICGAAVTSRYKQISDQISRNRRLKGRVNRIKKRIINN